jgi:4-hydroxythreonine-4-phosphate dehydrogenase
MKRVLITSGDPDGIGLEVVSKALEKIGTRSGFQFVLWRSPNGTPSDVRRLDRKFKRLILTPSEKWPAARSSELLDIVSTEPAARWVEDATRLCLRGQAAGLVTGPLSKTGIARAGLNDRGHTEILARLSKSKPPFMAFWGEKFKVVLLTDHRPLMTVASALTPLRIRHGLAAAAHLRALAKDKRPIALVGLNPHAGEQGLLGREELRLQKFINGRSVVGPLVPDSAFLPANWAKFSVFVCPYHDQGLIPFKLVHGFDEGVHLTLGLPFVRTSVDHGTAKDLFGRNLAKSGSMREAIMLAQQLIDGRS